MYRRKERADAPKDNWKGDERVDGQPALRFADWALEGSGRPVARQYDDNSRVLLVEGDLPEGWSWTMLTACGDNLDLIGLSPMEGGVGAVLTAEMLALAGWYRMQLRGTMGEQTRHTNVVRVFIPESLSGDARWPEVPSEFSQAEERAAAAAKAAAESAEAAGKAAEDALEALDKAPRIQDGTWWVWDARTGAYMDTGAAAQGEGVPETAAGDAGKFLQAGADGGQWDSPVVYIDSAAAGISWPDIDGSTVSGATVSALQDAFDNHKPLMMSAAFGGISGTLTMTASGGTGSSPIFTGIIYFPEDVFDLYGAVLQLNADSSKVTTIIGSLNVKGDDGSTFTPSVSADGTLSWSNDGGLPNPDPVNIRGPQGEQGIQGDAGPKGDPGEGVPAVSAADDGAFLRVRDGAWAAVQVPEAEGVGF